MKTEIIPATHPSAINHAIDVLNCCGLVAFPTDTVYGLAAPAFNEEAIERLYVVKGRNHTRAIALLMSKIHHLEQVAINITDLAQNLAKNFWPGPLTLILDRNPSLPGLLAPEPTIGVRIPDHPDALRLMDETGPLAVTSANISGEPPSKSAQEVMAQLKGRIHLIIDAGPSPGGVPSTVVDCTSPSLKILRTGPISLDQLQTAVS